jgi:hypothetical protein
VIGDEIVPELRMRDIALLITFTLGFFMVFEYFLVWPEVNSAATNFTRVCTALAGLSAIVGVGNLTRTHSKNVIRRGSNWIPSMLLLISLWIPLIIGLFLTRRDPTYVYLYNNLYTPVSQAFFALLGFYILSGAFRTFRAKSTDSIFLLITAALVFMGNSPVTGSIWPGFQAIKVWIMDNANSAGYRGVIMGVAIGTIVTSLRILIGRETGYLAERRARAE